MADFDFDSATPVGGGFDFDSATPVGGNLGGPGAAMSEGGKEPATDAIQLNLGEHFKNVAQKAYNYLSKKGHPDLAAAAYRAIDKTGEAGQLVEPHTYTDLALMLLSSGLGGIGKLGEMGAEALGEESGPLIGKTLDYISNLKVGGLKGAATRMGAMTAGGAATGAVTGEGALQGAEEGASYGAVGEVPGAIKDAGTGIKESLQQRSGIIGAAKEAEGLQSAGKLTPPDPEKGIAGPAFVGGNLAQREKAFQDAQAAIKSGNEAAATLGEVQDKQAAKIAKAAQQTAPAIRDRMIQEATGRTPAQTDEAINAPLEVGERGSVPGPDFVARKQSYLNASYAPLKQSQDELGRQFDERIGGFLDNKVEDTSALGAAVDDELNFAKENTIAHSPAIRKLFADATAMSPKAAIPIAAEGGKARLTNKEIVALNERLAALNESAGSAMKPTVAQIRGIRSQASDLVATSTGAHDRAAAAAVREAAEKSLESAGVPGVKELNAKYATFKNLTGRDYYRGIAKAKDPVDAAPLLFNEPQRTQLLWNNANPEQQQTLRNIYGDAVTQGTLKVDPKTQKDFLAKAFPNTKLTDPKSWIHLPNKLVKAQDLMMDDPEFGNMVGQMVQSEKDKLAPKIIQDLQPLMQQFGKAAQPLMEQLKQAKSPSEAAEMLISGLSGMKPEDAVRAMAAQQVQPRDAAIQSMQQGNVGQQPQGNRMVQYAKNKLPLYGSFTALSILTGRTPSQWIAGMAAIGLGSALLDSTGALFKRAFVKSLQTPGVAEAILAAVENPAAKASKNAMAMGITRLLASAGLNTFTHDAPTPNPATPMPELAPPMAPPPPPPSRAPLPVMMTGWRAAMNEKDTEKMKEIRGDVIKRVKEGEWQKLPPDQQKKLAPWMREMFGPKSSEALAG